MKRIITSIIVLFIGLLIVTGCEKEDNKQSSSGKIDSVDDLTSESGTLNCTRQGYASGDIKPSFSYVVTYRGGELLTLRAIEKVSSESGTGLDEYYSAYLNIDEKYKGLDYYNSKVIKDDNSVTRDTTIDYEHVDIDKLLHIEGNEDNIIDENGKASLDMWLALAKRFGTVCNESSN